MFELKFGFLNEPTKLSWSAGLVEPLPNYEEEVGKVMNSDRVYGGWYYPPLSQIATLASEPTKSPPLVERQAFDLPCTHRIEITDPGLTDCGPFFIALLGMLKGGRLQQEGWRHFYKAPISNELCDFEVVNKEISRALDSVTVFLQNNPDQKMRKLAFGALHWHLFAQLYPHEFDRFGAQYTALDACFRLAVETWPNVNSTGTHAERVENLCQTLNVKIPAWAQIIRPGRGKGKKKQEEAISPLSVARNELVHEAKYCEDPIGFKYIHEHSEMAMELSGLVARILLKLLGVDNEYTNSVSTTQQRHGFYW